jgi:hypothetical protein
MPPRNGQRSKDTNEPMSKELRDVYAVSCASVRQRRALGEQDLAPTVADAQFYASQFYASLGLAHKRSGLRPLKPGGFTTVVRLERGARGSGVQALPARK